MSEKVTSGQHEVHYEEETGFICLVHYGTIDVDDAKIVGEAIDRFSDRSGPGEPGFLLADNRNAGSITSEARKILTKTRVTRKEMYIAHFGASFFARSFINLMMKAISFSSYRFHVNAVATETEARAWLGEMKRAWNERKRPAAVAAAAK
ncbi:MAG TPA: hypothetical protein VM580_23025 [Labilithrix sp.]|nr:hypothetical protein [Labilithrix sp.]